MDSDNCISFRIQLPVQCQSEHTTVRESAGVDRRDDRISDQPVQGVPVRGPVLAVENHRPHGGSTLLPRELRRFLAGRSAEQSGDGTAGLPVPDLFLRDEWELVGRGK